MYPLNFSSQRPQSMQSNACVGIQEKASKANSMANNKLRDVQLNIQEAALCLSREERQAAAESFKVLKLLPDVYTDRNEALVSMDEGLRISSIALDFWNSQLTIWSAPVMGDKVLMKHRRSWKTSRWSIEPSRRWHNVEKCLHLHLSSS